MGTPKFSSTRIIHISWSSTRANYPSTTASWSVCIRLVLFLIELDRFDKKRTIRRFLGVAVVSPADGGGGYTFVFFLGCSGLLEMRLLHRFRVQHILAMVCWYMLDSGTGLSEFSKRTGWSFVVELHPLHIYHHPFRRGNKSIWFNLHKYFNKSLKLFRSSIQKTN